MKFMYVVFLFLTSVMDIRTRKIRNLFPAAIGGLALLWCRMGGISPGELLMGAILGGVPFFLSAWIFGTDTLGGGDVKFMFANGMMLGSRVLYASCIGVSLASLCLLAEKAMKKEKKKKKGVPLAPFLSIGCILAASFHPL